MHQLMQEDAIQLMGKKEKQRITKNRIVMNCLFQPKNIE